MNNGKLKYTTDTFIKRVKNVWGDRYIYDKIIYKGINNKIIVTCPNHGDFEIRATDFVNHHGCSICSGTKQHTRESFIEKANAVHNSNYDYSKVNYINYKTKVCIVCPEHGEFWQTPQRHIAGDRCPYCFKNFKKTTENFIDEARRIHGDKYDYSKVEYQGNKKYITITCPEHGDFKQLPQCHLQGQGCQKCYDRRRGNSTRKGKEQFIEDARRIHGDKYDYSKVEYKNNKTKVCIICSEHGEFWITPNKHLSGQGCALCADKLNGFNKRLTKEAFIKRSQEVHGDKYDYSKVEYETVETPVCIVCPKHGEFWQTPYSHMHGCGCRICNQSHLETKVRLFLEKNNIKFETQKRFDWLGTLSLDFYLPDYNIAIECQGLQHYYKEKIRWEGFDLNTIVERDKRKKSLCENNDVKLIYFCNDKKILSSDLLYNTDNTCLNLNTLFEKLNKFDNWLND